MLPNPGVVQNFFQALTQFAIAAPLLDLSFELAHLPIKRSEVLMETTHQFKEHPRHLLRRRRPSH